MGGHNQVPWQPGYNPGYTIQHTPTSSTYTYFHPSQAQSGGSGIQQVVNTNPPAGSSKVWGKFAFSPAANGANAATAMGHGLKAAGGTVKVSPVATWFAGKANLAKGAAGLLKKMTPTGVAIAGLTTLAQWYASNNIVDPPAGSPLGGYQSTPGTSTAPTYIYNGTATTAQGACEAAYGSFYMPAYRFTRIEMPGGLCWWTKVSTGAEKQLGNVLLGGPPTCPSGANYDVGDKLCHGTGTPSLLGEPDLETVLSNGNPPTDWGDLWADLSKGGASVQPDSGPAVTGPSSYPGPSTSTTNPDGSRTQKSTTVNVNYNGNSATYTTNTTTNNYNSGGQLTSTTTEESTPEEDQKQLCDLYPNIIACLEPGTDPGPQELQTKQVTLTFNPENISGPSACPAPISVGTSHGSYQMSFDPVCDMATSLRPLTVAFGFVTAGFIIFGGLRRA